MKVHLFLASALLGLAAIGNLHAQSYTKDVRPFLDKYCVECHRTGSVKAGVNLDNFTNLMKAARGNKKVVVSGDPDKSMLVLCTEGKARKMPPKKAKNQPTKDEIELVRKWVKEGAKDDTAKKTGARLEFLPPLPGSPRLLALDRVGRH